MSDRMKPKDEKKEAAKFAAQKALANEYPRTDKGFEQRIHGYLYFKYLLLYIYYMKKPLNKLQPEPDEMVYPAGENYDIIDDQVKMSADWANMTAQNMATNAYHAKVLRIEDARQFFTVNQDVNLPDLPKTIIPYEHARKLIIKNADHIGVMNCPCRTLRGAKACQPIDVCITIGEPWVSFVKQHNPEAQLRCITQEEALEIIEKQHELGNVQSAFFKDAANDRFYGICNCCTCCCVALLANNYAKAPLFEKSGYVRVTNTSKCKGCGTCVSYCHFLSPKIVSGKLVMDQSKCKGCGVCADKCPNKAITLELDDPSLSVPLVLDELMEKYQEK